MNPKFLIKQLGFFFLRVYGFEFIRQNKMRVYNPIWMPYSRWICWVGWFSSNLSVSLIWIVRGSEIQSDAFSRNVSNALLLSTVLLCLVISTGGQLAHSFLWTLFVCLWSLRPAHSPFLKHCFPYVTPLLRSLPVSSDSLTWHWQFPFKGWSVFYREWKGRSVRRRLPALERNKMTDLRE